MKNNKREVFMKNENDLCDKYLDEYLELDKNEVVPIKLTMHFLKCQKCRTTVHYLSKAEKLAADILNVKTSEVISKKNNPISMTKWVVGGIIMIILLVLFGVECKTSSSNLQIAFYMTFSIAVCAYCAFFVAINLEYFIKTIKKNKRFSSKELLG